MKRDDQLTDMWTRHAADWRDTAQVSSQWREAAGADPRLLESRAAKGWWQTLEQLGITLFITREYEHLVLALSVPHGRPKTTYFPMPHPAGLTVDRKAGTVYLASTRNPNQVFVFKPLSSLVERADVKLTGKPGTPLMPASCAYYPGSLYIHDLALIGGRLHANAVGHNAVVQLTCGKNFERVWWPKCIEVEGSPVFNRNHIQLNSIAAGKTLAQSFFSASSDKIGRLRPGHLNYPVDGRGVIFSGATREPICTGLTRPHSARLRPAGSRTTDDRILSSVAVAGGRAAVFSTESRHPEIWVDNSGYGELGFVQDGRLQVVRRLPGWTRGLSIVGDVAFVGTSRIIPKYARYAPGLDPASTMCAVHAVSCKTGALLGSLEWPDGNQIFALDWMPASATAGFIFEFPLRKQKRETALFYSYINQ